MSRSSVQDESRKGGAPARASRSDVYAGTERLGTVEFDGERFIACTADATPLGAFETSVAAARAICAAARARREADA